MNHLSWSEVKRKLQQTWSHLAPEELDRTRGDESQLIHLIHNKYGVAETQAEKAIKNIFKSVKASPTQEEEALPPPRKQDDVPHYPSELYEEDLPPETKLI